MTRISGPSSKVRIATTCLVVVLAAPLVVFLAVIGLKARVWDIETAYDVLTWKVALVLAGVGVLAALVGIVVGLAAPRRAGPIAVVVVVLSAATVGLLWREMAIRSGDETYGGGVATNPRDPIGFPQEVLATRRAQGADPLRLQSETGACPIQSIPTQVAPGVAGYALQEAGFSIDGIGVGRAYGSHTSTWFERTHDAVIRIRPGQTDVRVEARDWKRDHGAACRLAQKIVSNLQPRR